MAQSRPTALVVGATGVVGRNMVRHLNSQPEWDVIAVSRRTPDVRGGHRHVAVDLLDSADTQAKLGGLREITHVFYSAYVERQPWAAMVEPNVAMLTNVLDTVEAAADHLRHVNLVHGTKWYGNHLGPFKTPAQESDARHMPPNFYYDQQALVEERRRRSQWAWSSARPHGICGFAVGNPMNLVMVLAVYATVSKALGLPLRHPGSEANAAALYNVTDSSLLARACQWMATEPTAANEPFNITNGDVFRWRDLWPAIANYFDMPTATAQRIDLVEMMADKAPLWEQLTAQHDLLPIPYRDLVGWGYGNFVFTPDYDVISSTTKARLHGFAEVQDTQAMFLRHFDELRRQKVIP